MGFGLMSDAAVVLAVDEDVNAKDGVVGVEDDNKDEEEFEDNDEFDEDKVDGSW